MHVVLFEPEIPQNTGNIARTCAATGASLDLIEPLGFSLADRYLKRAGLDYWHLVDLHVYRSFEDLLSERPDATFYFTSTKAGKSYADVRYAPGDHLVFGPETRGLPEPLLRLQYDRAIRIPMKEDARSLNLSNAVAIILYEALRQTGFDGLCGRGTLTGRKDAQMPWMAGIGGEDARS